MKRRRKTQQLRIDSLTEVNLNYTHGFGIWGNPRVVFGVRVDEGLKKAFTKVAKAKFGSTCNPIESFMAAVVGVYQNPTLDEVNPSITIGEIKIERNLRERRKVVIEQEAAETIHARLDDRLSRLKVVGKELSERPALDYSKMSVEELQRRCVVAQKRVNLGQLYAISHELKLRGIGEPFNPHLYGAKSQ